MLLFAFLSSTNRTHKPSVSRPQVFHFHVVPWARLGEKGLKPFYQSCALWVLKITALQPHEGRPSTVSLSIAQRKAKYLLNRVKLDRFVIVTKQRGDCEQSLFFFRFSKGSARARVHSAWSFACLSVFGSFNWSFCQKSLNVADSVSLDQAPQWGKKAKKKIIIKLARFARRFHFFLSLLFHPVFCLLNPRNQSISTGFHKYK